jgi:hypothetical protein
MTEHGFPDAAGAADPRVALDPTTAPEVLARIAETRPELRVFVAMNPSTYPALVQWLAQLGDPAVDAALATRTVGSPVDADVRSTGPRPRPWTRVLSRFAARPDGVEPQDPGHRPRRRWIALSAAVAGVAVLAVAGWLIVGAIFGGGGASSPEAAVRDLADSLNRKDPAAAMAILAPDEVRMFDKLVTDTETRATAMGFAKQGSTFAGIDLNLTGLGLHVEQLSPDVARVDVTSGSLSVTANKAGLTTRSQGALHSTRFTGATVTADDVRFRNAAGQDVPGFVMVVRQNGGWYVSPLYTAAQLLAEKQGLHTPSFTTQAWKPAAQADPEAAVKAFLEAAGSLDPDKIAQAVPEGEAAAVTAYSRLLTDLPGRSPGGSLSNVSLRVDDIKSTVNDLGKGLATVTIDSLDTTVSTATQQDRVRVDQSCVRTNDDPEACPDGLSGKARLTFVAVQGSAGWTVSPLDSIAQTLRTVVSSIDENYLLKEMNLAWLIKPTASLAVGSGGVAAQTDASGLLTATLTGSAGSVFVSPGLDRESAISLYTSAGDPVPDNGAWNLPADGVYTVVVQSAPSKNVRLVGTTAPPAALAPDTPASGRLDADNIGRAFAVDVPTVGLSVDLEGNGGWELWRGTDDLCNGSAGGAVACDASIVAGPAVLYVTPRSGDTAGGDFTLTAGPTPRTSIDGIGPSINKSLGAGLTDVHVISAIPAYSSVDITLTPSSGNDLVLGVDDPQSGFTRVDSGVSGYPEYYTVHNTSSTSRNVTVQVSDFNQAPGTYTLAIADPVTASGD